MMTTQNKQFSIYGAVIEKLYDYLFGDGRARGIIQLCTFAVAFAYVLVTMLVFGKPTFSVVSGCVALIAALLVGVPITQACLEVRRERGSFLPTERASLEEWLRLPYPEAQRAFDRVYMQRKLQEQGYVTRAAKAAGIDPKTFRKHWDEAGLPALSEKEE